MIHKKDLQKRVSEVNAEIDRVFKLPTESLEQLANQGFGSNAKLSGGTREEYLCVYLKGLVHDKFHPGW